MYFLMYIYIVIYIYIYIYIYIIYMYYCIYTYVYIYIYIYIYIYCGTCSFLKKKCNIYLFKQSSGLFNLLHVFTSLDSTN